MPRATRKSSSRGMSSQKLRYNRLIDVFIGVTCYSLQNHLRTTEPRIGQFETDEIYVNTDLGRSQPRR